MCSERDGRGCAAHFESFLLIMCGPRAKSLPYFCAMLCCLIPPRWDYTFKSGLAFFRSTNFYNYWIDDNYHSYLMSGLDGGLQLDG